LQCLPAAAIAAFEGTVGWLLQIALLIAARDRATDHAAAMQELDLSHAVSNDLSVSI
jgi:hypothetical protein